MFTAVYDEYSLRSEQSFTCVVGTQSNCLVSAVGHYLTQTKEIYVMLF